MTRSRNSQRGVRHSTRSTHSDDNRSYGGSSRRAPLVLSEDSVDDALFLEAACTEDEYRGAVDIEEYNTAEDSWQPLADATLPAAATRSVADDATSEWSFVSKAESEWTLEWELSAAPDGAITEWQSDALIARMLQDEERDSYRTFRTNEAARPRRRR